MERQFTVCLSPILYLCNQMLSKVLMQIFWKYKEKVRQFTVCLSPIFYATRCSQKFKCKFSENTKKKCANSPSAYPPFSMQPNALKSCNVPFLKIPTKKGKVPLFTVRFSHHFLVSPNALKNILATFLKIMNFFIYFIDFPYHLCFKFFNGVVFFSHSQPLSTIPSLRQW